MTSLSIVMCSGTAVLVGGIALTLIAPDERFQIPARRAAAASAASATAAIVFAIGAVTIRPAGVATAVAGAAALLALAWGRSDLIYWRTLRAAEAQEVGDQRVRYATFDQADVVEPPITGASPTTHGAGWNNRAISSCDGSGAVGAPRSAQILQRARPGN